jgi:hypothetical protein
MAKAKVAGATPCAVLRAIGARIIHPGLFGCHMHYGLSAVNISNLANGALDEPGRQETGGSLRRLESCVLHPGRFRRPLRLDDAILEFGFLHSSILESGYAAILELGCRQVNRCTRDQESSAADHHSGKSNAEVAGHRKLRAVKRAG